MAQLKYYKFKILPACFLVSLDLGRQLPNFPSPAFVSFERQGGFSVPPESYVARFKFSNAHRGMKITIFTSFTGNLQGDGDERVVQLPKAHICVSGVQQPLLSRNLR